MILFISKSNFCSFYKKKNSLKNGFVFKLRLKSALFWFLNLTFFLQILKQQLLYYPYCCQLDILQDGSTYLVWFCSRSSDRWNHRGKGAICHPHQILAKLQEKTVPSLSFVKGLLGQCNFVYPRRAILLQKSY